LSVPEGLLKITRVVSAPAVRESEARVTIPVPGHECGEEPRVDLVREGDIVRAIDITCPCGRRVRVLCEYPGLVSR
jgi:hypothetical protein